MSDIHARQHRLTGKMRIDTWQNPAFEFDDITAAGAYSAYPRTSCVEANQVLNIAGGPYNIENFRAKTTVVFQNMVPTSQYRAVGHPMGIVICDSLLDKAAVVAGIDRMEIRRRNLISDDAYPASSPAGIPLHDLSHQACLEKLAKVINIDALTADQAAAREQESIVASATRPSSRALTRAR